MSAYSSFAPKNISPLPSRWVSSYFCDFAGRRRSAGVCDTMRDPAGNTISRDLGFHT
jgi:hypothetical protein